MNGTVAFALSYGMPALIGVIVLIGLAFGVKAAREELQLRRQRRRQEIWGKAQRRYRLSLSERQLSELLDRAHATMLPDGRRLRYDPVEHEVSLTRGGMLRTS